MSFNELAITIMAENLASSEFLRVASDAATMASQVSGQSMVLHAENLASPEIAKIAEEAAAVKAAVEASPITISFEPVEVPSLPSVDSAPIQAGLNDISVSAASMAENVQAAVSAFDMFKVEAEATTFSLRAMASAFGAVTHMGTAVISLAGDLGIVDRESAKWARTIMTVMTLTSSWIRLQNYLTILTTGHTTAITVNTTAQNANATTSLAVAVAQKIKAAATWAATAAQNALNVSHATFLALTGIGIGVIIAAAAAMAYFASQMNAATASVQNFNEAAGSMPFAGHSIRRAGEEELYRRGVE